MVSCLTLRSKTPCMCYIHTSRLPLRIAYNVYMMMFAGSASKTFFACGMCSIIICFISTLLCFIDVHVISISNCVSISKKLCGVRMTAAKCVLSLNRERVGERERDLYVVFFFVWFCSVWQTDKLQNRKRQTDNRCHIQIWSCFCLSSGLLVSYNIHISTDPEDYLHMDSVQPILCLPFPSEIEKFV